MPVFDNHGAEGRQPRATIGAPTCQQTRPYSGIVETFAFGIFGRQRRVLSAKYDGTGTADAPLMGMKRKRRTTLLELVQDLQRRTSSEAELVRRVRRLVNSGAVLLTGNFAGQRF